VAAIGLSACRGPAGLQATATAQPETTASATAQTTTQIATPDPDVGPFASVSSPHGEQLRAAGAPDQWIRALQTIPAAVEWVELLDRRAIRDAVAGPLEAGSGYEAWEEADRAVSMSGQHHCGYGWPDCTRRDRETFDGWQQRFGFPLSEVEVIVSTSTRGISVVMGDFAAADVTSAFHADPEFSGDLVPFDLGSVAPGRVGYTWDFNCNLSHARFPDRREGCPGEAFVDDGILLWSPGPVKVREGAPPPPSILTAVAAGLGGEPAIIDDGALAAGLAATQAIDPVHLYASFVAWPTFKRVSDEAHEAAATSAHVPVPQLALVVGTLGDTDHLALVYPPGVDAALLVEQLAATLTSEAAAAAWRRLEPGALRVRADGRVLVADVVGHKHELARLYNQELASLVLYGE
jgi:hypothetical protein